MDKVIDNQGLAVANVLLGAIRREKEILIHNSCYINTEIGIKSQKPHSTNLYPFPIMVTICSLPIFSRIFLT